MWSIILKMVGYICVTFQTFVGNASYNITHINGTTSTAWGTGNDNLCFDTIGNLWVLQDGSNNHIWMVAKGHTQSSPKVKLFARTPAGSEPTGITFTPDDKFMFMSIMHPSNTNATTQKDAYSSDVKFDKAVSLIIARDSSFIALPIVKNSFWGVYDGVGVTLNWSSVMEFNNYGYIVQKSLDGMQWQDIGMVMSQNRGNSLTQYTFYDQSVLEQNTFYRLRQTDVKGDETLSEVVLVKPIIGQLGAHQSLFPNPAERNQEVLSTLSRPVGCVDIYGRVYAIQTSMYKDKWMFQAPIMVGIYTVLFENNSSQILVVNH
ncbi:MAG: DUF839 domain-containing protein [Bacteroidetes bacterium]|nr:DUF839 domain-containing protein [Bacteroidota bacterium]